MGQVFKITENSLSGDHTLELKGRLEKSRAIVNISAIDENYYQLSNLTFGVRMVV